MIDNKEIDAYLSIKAPDSVKERLLEEQAKNYSKISLKVRTCYAVAAVLLLIVAVFAFLPDASTSIYFGDTPLDKDAVIIKAATQNAGIALLSTRNVEEIPLSVKTDKETEIKVSHGSIMLFENGEAFDAGHTVTVDCDTLFLWSVNADSSPDGHTLTVGKDSYCISVNSKSQWVLSKK